MSTIHHQAAGEAAQRRPVRCAVLTVSDTRTEETDSGGRRLCDILHEHGHQVVDRAIVPDEPQAIAAQLESWLSRTDLDAILTTGGTGIALRDTTIEVVKGLLRIELEGFGELFRMLSWAEVGPAAMLSRAAAGLVVRPVDQGGETLLFAMPGSINAVETATTKLIAPELVHLVWERKR